VSKTAHKVEREHRVIAALQGTDVPVPGAVCLCADERVVGTPFYIMTFLDGRIITDPSIPGVAPETRRAMWEDAVRTLARLHRVAPRDVGLEGFGRPAGFYSRQVETWRTICAAQAATRDAETGKPVGDFPHFKAMVDFFTDKERQPKDRTGLVHGDYKIDNLVFHPTEPRVIGILEYVPTPVSHVLRTLLTPLLFPSAGRCPQQATPSPTFSTSSPPSPPPPTRACHRTTRPSRRTRRSRQACRRPRR
jgi:aminoglycoside phosphotransferase (APT) family kinase protein